LFKWSANYAEASVKFEQAAKMFKEVGDTKMAIKVYLEFAKSSESQNEYLGQGEGLMEAALLMPLN